MSSGNSLSVDTTLQHSGANSLKAVQVSGTAGNANVSKTLSTGQSKLDVRAYVYLSNPVTWGAVQVLSLYSGSTFIGWVTYNADPSSPTLTVYNGASNHLYTCSSVPSLNGWHSLELQYTLSTTTGGFSLWLDEVQVCQASGIKTVRQNTVLANRVVVGVDSADKRVGLTVHVDDVVVSPNYIGP